MYGLAVFDSGNYAFNLCRNLERKGYIFEVVATPCQIASEGCGYSLKFPIEAKELVIRESTSDKIPVRAMYKMVPTLMKNKYERVY